MSLLKLKLLIFMKKGLLYIFILLSVSTSAQVPLTLTNAIDTALKNNYDIQIAKNNNQISALNNTYGVAGGLPHLTVVPEIMNL